MDRDVASLIRQYKDVQGPLLPLLHAVQSHCGYISHEAEKAIANALNLSGAEVRGVVSFYHDFRTSPSGRVQIKVCNAEACQARGARRLVQHVTGRLNIGFGETTSDGAITLEKVFCLGNCACGPSLAVGDDVYANVDEMLFDQLLDELTTPVPQ
jgi:formate dehydrogenase subunit gamma